MTMFLLYRLAPWQALAIGLFYTGLAFGNTKADVAGSLAGPDQPAASNQERKPDMKENQVVAWNPGFSAEEKKTLLTIARDTLEWCAGNSKTPFAMDKYSVSDAMRKDTATFVTLKIRGDLRGCIGSLAPEEPLYLSVHHNAVNAAMHDPRFRPVANDELRHIRVDVSVLSPIRPIASLSEFQVGRHGIILSKDGRRAVFLPEVALEQGWGMEETLNHLSRKAGLPVDAWRKGATYQVFESFVLHE